MRILVTGGTGSVGVFVAAELVRRGHRPVVLGRHLDSTLLDEQPPGAVGRLVGDILDRPALTEAMRAHRVDRVIHLAAMLDECQRQPADAVEVNLGGTVNVLEAARAAGVQRVVFTSSKRALGPVSDAHGHPDYVPITEDYPPRPLLMYDVTKFAAEMIGNNYERRYGLQFVTVRFAQSYGPGRAGRGVPGLSSLRSKIIEDALAGRPVRIPSGGDSRDDCIYVRDVADGIVAACLTDDLGHRLYHLGTGRSVSLHDFSAAVRAVLPGAQIEIGPGLDYRHDVGYRFDCVFDITRARRELLFEPAYDLPAGVSDYVAVARRLGIG